MKKDTGFWLEVASWTLGLFVIVLSSCVLFRMCKGKPPVPSAIVKIDTIKVYKSIPSESVTIRRDTIRYVSYKDVVKTEHKTDTLIKVDTVEKTVSLPITRKTYHDSTYTAIVSGYSPSLDYIETYSRTEYRNIVKWKKPRFSLGLGGGYYLTPKGLQPGMGVTLQYNILNIK